MHLVIAPPAWLGVAAIHLHHFFHHFFHHLFHHRFHGPPFDYVGLAAGAFVSSAGIPGPGEALLIAGGIIAASGRLDIASVILIAFVGATLGGIVGWLIGMKVGRTVLAAPGPFLHARLRTLARGDRIFHRYVALAVILTPAWVAGIHHVRSLVYQPWNAVSAAMWAVGVGLGAYYAGPPVVDAVADLGYVTVAVIAAIVLGAIGGEFLRRRRIQRRTAARGSAERSADLPRSPETSRSADSPRSAESP